MSLTFRIYNDEKPLSESPCRDAYRIENGVGWAIDIDKTEDLQGLAGYGGRVEVTIDADDCRINLTPLETIREEWRARMEAREREHKNAPRAPRLTLSPASDRFRQAMSLVMADYDLSPDVIAEVIRIARAL